jgi:hypothetical protein
MKTPSCVLVIIVVHYGLLAFLVMQDAVTMSPNGGKPTSPNIIVSKATTYVTGPLNKDGSVDFAGAINRFYSLGVTTKNNANVLIWQAIGPHPENTKMPSRFFELLGIKQPPEKGDYFIDFFDFLERWPRGRCCTSKPRSMKRPGKISLPAYVSVGSSKVGR